MKIKQSNIENKKTTIIKSELKSKLIILQCEFEKSMTREEMDKTIDLFEKILKVDGRYILYKVVAEYNCEQTRLEWNTVEEYIDSLRIKNNK